MICDNCMVVCAYSNCVACVCAYLLCCLCLVCKKAELQRGLRHSDLLQRPLELGDSIVVNRGGGLLFFRLLLFDSLHHRVAPEL